MVPIGAAGPDADTGLSAYSGQPVIVTGARGFIGARLARRLERLGARVTEAARPATDLSAEGRALRLTRDVRPAIVFNLAAYGVHSDQNDDRTAEAINHGLVAALCESLERVPARPGWRGLRLVHTGTAVEYGMAPGDLGEETLPQPTTVYGRTKFAGTEEVIAHGRRGLKAVTARLFTVYGPGEREGRLLPALLKAAGEDGPLQLTDGRQRRDFTYVDDVVEFLLALGLAPAQPGEVVNLATGRLTTVRRFVEVAATIIGIPRERLAFGALPTRDWEMRHAPVRVTRLRELTGRMPSTSISDGIRRTLVVQGEKTRSSTPK